MTLSALTASDLGKAYRSYRRPIDSLKEFVTGRTYAETFWAVRGINLDVPAGGSLGIVGDNGAGKSTLLKLLAGATTATEGGVARRGRTSAILSLGAGFHADLSGAENIRIGCAVLGLSPEETNLLAPAIVDFSELGAFIDKPLKTYSSGMYLRLGFSVATAINPDILIVDEHLSVGDQHFRHKCLRRIMALREAGCSLVFCSHDLYSVEEVCDRTLWIRDGRASMLGPTADVLGRYQDHVRERDGRGEVEGLQTPAIRSQALDARSTENRIESVTLGGDIVDGVIRSGAQLVVEIRFRLEDTAYAEGVGIGFLIVRNDALWCYGVPNKSARASECLQRIDASTYRAVVAFDSLPLLTGSYSFSIALMDINSPHLYDTVAAAAPFRVVHDGKDVGVVRIAHRWEAVAGEESRRQGRHASP